MKGDTSSETGDDFPVAAARSILRRGLPQFAGFELLFRLLGLAVFVPFTAWLTSRLIAWSGSGAVSNYDLAGFFLSFKGLCYLIVVVTIGFALAFFEFGGLTALAISLQRRKRTGQLPYGTAGREIHLHQGVIDGANNRTPSVRRDHGRGPGGDRNGNIVGIGENRLALRTVPRWRQRYGLA